MRGLKRVIVILMVSAIPALAQVDTLQLVEIGSIEAPGEITNLYVEDLDGDSLKEIILTTATNVHIYNGITYEEIWTSPELDHPEDLLFADINNDGFIDFSEKDTTNIRLFDPHNDATIWTSPALDSTYKCYTIGDRNDDEWIDVAIVSKEPFTRENDPENLDTVWIQIYDGPDYVPSELLTVLMTNYSWGDMWGQYSTYEIPNRVLFCNLSSDEVLEDRIAIISDVHSSGSGSNPGYESHRTTGNLWLIDSDDFSSILIEDIGMLTKYEITTINNHTYLYTLNFIGSYFDHDGPIFSIRRDINTISADTLIASVTLHQAADYGHYPPDWRGFLMEDIITDYSGAELCYLLADSMTVFSVNFDIIFWRVGGMAPDLTVRHYYSSEVLGSEPSIMCRDYTTGDYLIFDAGSGSLSAHLLVLDDVEFSLTEDIDDNGDYELISIEDDMIRVFLADHLIGTEGESPNLPQSDWFTNYPNPFNSTTTIEYGLPETGRVTIEIYDLLGRRVETLVDEEQEAGQHRVIWNAGEHTSGIYFYRIVVGDKTETRRMVLLK